MGLPKIDISFKQLAKTAVTRSQRGIVSFNIKATTPLWLLLTADLANCLNDISILGKPILHLRI